MINQVAERTIARILGFGSAFVAVVVVTGTVTDPVNVTKLFALGGVAAGAFAVVLGFGVKELWLSSKALVLLVGLFLLASVNAIINSSGPLTQNLYGAYGRNTAFVTYLLLVFLILSAVVLRTNKSFTTLIYGLFIAGVVNVIYCGWVFLFGDFIPWTNPYGNILGTFGNPNFIGAFLGLFAASLVAYSFKSGLHIGLRLLSVVIFVIAVIEIIDSNAIQGRVVVAAGLAIVGFYLVRSKLENALFQVGYVVLISIGGVFALLGALQIGPLTKYIYKTSVSLRGEYWQAGWNMGSEHPFTGVGFDTYGDWYRRARDTQALVLPGPNTTTNAAHNVPFDVFAFGGWPLFISYLGILLLSVIAIIKVTARTRTYDPIFVTLTTAWVCYQLQSIISINQIGLAIWGWLFGGALIAYEIATRPAKVSDESTNSTAPKGRRVVRQKQNEAIFSSTMIAGVGAVVGLLIAAPPYSADAKWRSALATQNAQSLEEALVPGYLNPANSYKYANAVQLLENSKLYDLAYKYAQISVQFNPDNFDSWKMFYFISKSSAAEKAIALENMKRLDPNNPNVLG
jgi:O-antigen ligase